MLKAILGLAALVALASMLADPDELKRQRVIVNRFARPVFFAAAALVAFAFFGYPMIWGDGVPFD